MYSNVNKIYALLIANFMETCKIEIFIIEKLLINIDAKTKVCIDDNPQTKLIQFIQTNELDKLEENNLFILYFSGHGDRIGKRINNKMEMISTWINIDDTYSYSYNIDKILSKLNCKILLISDSCYSGSFGKYYFGSSPLLFIGSSSINNKSREYVNSKEKRGILFYIFSEIVNNLKNITLCEIKDIINKMITKHKIKIKPVIKTFNINEQILE